MLSILEKIVQTKKQEVANLKAKFSEEELKNLIQKNNYKIKNLPENGKLNLIAEIKKKSPSKGIIRHDFDPKKIASEFEKFGSSAISILTDKEYFGGKNQYLTEVRESLELPILRKDFIVDKFQILETASLKADIILLIVSVLKNNLLEFIEESLKWNLNILIETHTQKELELTLKVLEKLELNESKKQKILIGINNRNLNTFETNLETSFKLKKLIPKEYKTVCESGVFEILDLEKIKEKVFLGGFDR